MWQRLFFSALITLSGSGSWASQGKPPVYTPHDLFTALNRCWMPPPVELAKQGAEITVRASFRRDGTVIGQPRVAYFSHGVPEFAKNAYRHAIQQTFKRCEPFNFSGEFGAAFAGRIFFFKLNDNRPTPAGREI